MEIRQRAHAHAGRKLTPRSFHCSVRVVLLLLAYLRPSARTCAGRLRPVITREPGNWERSSRDFPSGIPIACRTCRPRSAILAENRHRGKEDRKKVINPSDSAQTYSIRGSSERGSEDGANKFSRLRGTTKRPEGETGWRGWGIRLARNEHAVIPLETILNIFYLPPRGISKFKGKREREASLSARFPNSPRSKQ